MSAYSTLILASSPNGYWRLGESSGTVAASEVNNATMQGVYSGVTLGAAGAIIGDPDTAATFTLSSTNSVGALAGAHQTLQDVGDVFTWEAWLKRSSVGVSAATPYTNGGGPSFCVRFNADNTLRLDKEGTAVIVASTTTIADTTKFHHCVVTKTGATVKIYIDGVDVTGTVTNQTIGNPTAKWAMGQDGGGVNYFFGDMDEAALYPTVLSAATVLSHYQTGINPNVPLTFKAIPFMSNRRL